MILVHESLTSTCSCPKPTLWIHFTPSSFFLLLPSTSKASPCAFETTYNSTTYRCLRRPPLEMSRPSQAMLDKLHFNQCNPNPFSYIIVSDSVHSCMTTDPSQHTYLCYTHFFDVLSFSGPTFCPIQHRRPDRRPVELVFELL